MDSKKHFFARLAVAGFFFAYAIVLSTTNNDNHFKKDSIMDNLYPVLFANTLQNNLTLAAVHAVGKEAWHKRRAETELGAAGYLLVSHSTVFIVAAERITAIDATGKELWSHNKWTNSPVFLSDNVLYCQSFRNKSLLERVELSAGEAIKADISLPSTQDKEKALFIDPYEKDFIACCQLPSSQTVKSGKPQSFPPYYTVYRKTYDNWDFTWVAEEQDLVILPIMYIPKIKQLCIGTQHSMVFYNSESLVNEPKPSGNISYPLRIVKNVCADSEGNLYFIGVSDTKEKLVACGNKGNIKWEWNREGIANSSQPLAMMASIGEIILISGRTICCVKDGKLAWEFSTGLQDPKYVTATSDGCVLIAASDMLFCCKDGIKIFNFNAGSTIIAPPVVDADGCIYLLTPTEVIKVL